MLKSFAKKILKNYGFELCKLAPEELADIGHTTADPLTFNFKEIQAIRAIAAPGHITLNEARFLGELVQRTRPDSTIVEIGALFGFSTRVLALYKHSGQPLISIDSFLWNPLGLSPSAHETATRTALQDLTASQNLRLLRADKERFYEEYAGPPPGLFFCDADHGYEATMNDLRWATQIGAAIICGHDYNPTVHPGVVQAVDELGGPSELVDSLFVL
jgi:hypothetical protein